MKKSILFFFALIMTSFVFVPSSPAEKMTITTYYPSPHGVYDQLRFYPRDVELLGDCKVGTLYAYLPTPTSEPTEVYFCESTGAGLDRGKWIPFSETFFSGIWEPNDDDEAILKPLYRFNNVGIGTDDPVATLDVRGNGYFGRDDPPLEVGSGLVHATGADLEITAPSGNTKIEGGRITFSTRSGVLRGELEMGTGGAGIPYLKNTTGTALKLNPAGDGGPVCVRNCVAGSTASLQVFSVGSPAEAMSVAGNLRLDGGIAYLNQIETIGPITSGGKLNVTTSAEIDGDLTVHGTIHCLSCESWDHAWLDLGPERFLQMARGPASSREYKENITPLSMHEALAVFQKFEPVKFRYKESFSEDNREEHVGFIAEDVPDLVAAEDRKTVPTMDMVGILTKVVQHQQEMIEKQQKEINELKKILKDSF
jgi:hypothetical protein